MIDALLERVRRLLDSNRDNRWAVDVRQTREELAAEQEKAEKVLDQLAEADFDLEMAESDTEGENA